jgi:hypothetical protein
MNINKKPPMTRKQIKTIRSVEAIQRNARESKTHGVSKTLTFQQGLSVLLRSQELKAEQEGITAEQKVFQIDECYRLRRAQLNLVLPLRR